MIKLKSNILLFTTAIIWGVAFVAQRLGAEHVGAFTFNGVRFLLGAVSLIPVIVFFEHRKKEAAIHSKLIKTTILFGIVGGVVLFAASTLQQIGIEITQSAGKAGFITGLYIVLVPIFGIFMGKRTGINIWFGAVLCVVGMFLLCVNEKTGIGIGDAVLIVGAVFWAMHILVIDKFGDSVYSLRFALVQFVVCGALSLACAFLYEDVVFEEIKRAGIPIMYGGIMSVGVAYTCQILGQKISDPTYASIVFSTESVFSAIGGAIILHEVMTGRGYLGCLLIFSGIIISQLKFSKNKIRGM